MQGVILKESEILNKALSGSKVSKSEIPDILTVLARHYFSTGLNKEEVYNKLNEYYKSTGIGYNETVSYEFINKLINRVYNSCRFNLIDISAITISINEWNKIIDLNDKHAEKLAFSILVHQKIEEIKNPRSSGWVNSSRSYMLSDAGFTTQTKDIKLNFHKLCMCGYLGKRRSVDGTGYLVNYRDSDKTLYPPKIIITKFDKIITYYDEHRNGVKYKECEVCGKRFKLSKNDYSSKYCTPCGKKVNIIKTNSKKINKSKKILKA